MTIAFANRPANTLCGAPCGLLGIGPVRGRIAAGAATSGPASLLTRAETDTFTTTVDDAQIQPTIESTGADEVYLAPHSGGQYSRFHPARLALLYGAITILT